MSLARRNADRHLFRKIDGGIFIVARHFIIASLLITIAEALLAWFWPPGLWSLIVFGPIIVVGYLDYFQTRQGVRRNFPLIGNLRYFFELIRPELQQYFVEDNLSGRPVPRELRSIVYQRAKGENQTVPFGTQRDVYEANHEWVEHSIIPASVKNEDMRVTVGGRHCRQRYSASIFNISAMSYGALSHAAISALNLGAQKGKFYHNSGEGGLSPFHLHGGDVVWQIGTGYFGCRHQDGRFDANAFQDRAQLPQVKMIELKLSQGAKPGKGGLLPAKKVSAEIAKIRLVEIGKTVFSPAAHSAFSTPIGLLEFLQKLRELSGGKPVGFKLCIGQRHEFFAICKAMIKTGITPDFITVDGAEGGTGAAPLEFANSVGTPLDEGLVFVDDVLRGFGLRQEIRLISSGKVFTAFHLLTKLALGADMVNSARGMMLALGCIQALKCNTNHCPVGVATSDPRLVRGLHVPSKAERVYHFHHETVHAFAEILGAMGRMHPSELTREDVRRRLSDGVVKTYEELFPILPVNAITIADLGHIKPEYIEAFDRSQAESFKPVPSAAAHFMRAAGQ
jgi:glutamate synthase domain-containing protein 2